MKKYLTKSISGILCLLAVLALPSIGQQLPFCTGGLHAPGQKQQRAAGDFLRWGNAPHTVVTFSFVRTAYQEQAEAVSISPIIDANGAGISPFPINSRELIRNAFIGWSAVSDLTFVEVEENNGDIGQIRVGFHNFSEIGSPSSVLAHGFFPPDDGISGNDVSGDLHFNGEEIFTESEFFSTAIHEIGHNLGLDHVVRKKNSPPPGIVMYAILESTTGPLTEYDEAYVQEVYGPPVPSIESANPQLITWRYPFDPFQSQPFSPTNVDSDNPAHPRTSAYTMNFIRCSGSDFAICQQENDPNLLDNDVLINSITAHHMTAFDLQVSASSEIETLSDDAENDQRLLDSAFDDDIAVGWEIKADRSPESDQAFVIDFDGTPFAATYVLPFISFVEATETTRWKFKRSYILSKDQNIEYLVQDSFGNTLFSFIESNNGTTSPVDVTYSNSPTGTLPAELSFQNDEITIDLSAFAGEVLSLEYRFTAGESSFFTEIFYLDDIVLENILSSGNSFSSLTEPISFSENSLDVSAFSLTDGHRVKMQAQYGNSYPKPPVFSAEFSLSLENQSPICNALDISILPGEVFTSNTPIASDIEGDNLTFTVIGGSINQGVLDIHADGSITYTANSNASGSDSVTIEVSDGINTEICTIDIAILFDIQEIKFLASDSDADDQFGRSVVIDGETIVVGAPFDEDNGENSGAAYVLEKDAAGNWNQMQKITPNDGDADDLFGTTIAIYDDSFIVCAPGDEDNPGFGSAYVFKKSVAGNWVQEAKLLPNDNSPFANAVAIDGAAIAIGAPFDSDNGQDAGAVYVFEKDTAGNWNQMQKIAPSDGDSDDQFGSSLDMYGSTIIIGAPGDEDNPGFGSTYVFEKSAAGNWNQKAKLIPDDNSPFADAVAIDGATIAIGAPFDDDNGQDAGVVYVFEKDTAGNWNQMQKISPSDGDSDDRFVSTVAIYSSTIVIGTPIDEENPGEGSAYVFSQDTTGNWVQKVKLLPSDDAPFADAVAIYSGTIVIGAPFDDGNGFATGAIYIFDLGLDEDNQPPVCAASDFIIVEGQELQGQLNATDDDGDSLSFTETFAPDHGSLTLNLDGTFIYQPDSGFIGNDAFTFTVTDEKGASPQEVCTVNITVRTPDVTASREFSSSGYSSPGILDINVIIDHTGTETLTSLAVSETIPANWTFASVTSNNDLEMKPQVGANGTLDFSWINTPSLPVTLTYRLNIPAGESGIKFFAGDVKYRTTGSEISQLVSGDQEISPVSFHDADQNEDFEIQLSPELTRLIQFFNSGGYHCEGGTEDGFAPGIGSEDCVLHDADQNEDFEIQLSPELTRLIQFFNSGGYHLESGTEDGFAPGKPSSVGNAVKKLTSSVKNATSDDINSVRAHDVMYPPSSTIPIAIEISVIIDYTGSETITSLAVAETVPANWTFDSVSGNNAPDIQPSFGADGTLEFAWSIIPDFPITLAYRLKIPAGESGTKSFIGDVKFRTTGGELSQTTPETTISNENTGNNLPVCGTTDIIVESNNTVSGTISATDTDGDSLTFTLNTDGSEGTASVNTDGSFDYAANTTTATSDSFTVDVTDGTDTVTCTINVTITQFGDWQFALNIAPSSNAVRDKVILGMQVGATDGVDFQVDQDVPPQEPTSTLADIYFDQNFTFLSRDIRGQSEEAGWLLVVDPRGNTVEFFWNSEQIPAAKILSLYEVDFDDNPLPKSSILMNETTTLTVDGNKERWYRLRYADDFRATFTLTDGWNLLSFPMDLTTPEVDDIFSDDSTEGLDEQEKASFRDGRRGVMISGDVWTWEGNGYVRVTRLERLKGYWVFLNEDTKTITVDGSPVIADENGDVIVLLSQGWNLYGSVVPVPITYPLSAPLQGTIWTWDGAKYQAATVLQPSEGYWINSFESDASFNLAK